MINRTSSCLVWAYDFSVDKMNLPSNLPQKLKDRLHFFKLGLGSKVLAEKNATFRTLGQLMTENGHDWIDFLKVA
jgi:hypothetical protein